MAATSVKPNTGLGEVLITPQDIENLRQYSSVSRDVIDRIEQGQGTLKLAREEFYKIQDFTEFFNKDLEDIGRTLKEIKEDVGGGLTNFKELSGLSTRLAKSYAGLKNVLDKPGGFGIKDLNRELLIARNNLKDVRADVANIEKDYGRSATHLNQSIPDFLLRMRDEKQASAIFYKNKATAPNISRRTREKHWTKYRDLTKDISDLNAQYEIYTLGLEKAEKLESIASKSLNDWVAGGLRLGLVGTAAQSLGKILSKLPGFEGTGQTLGERTSSVRSRVGSGKLSELQGKLELATAIRGILFSWGTALGLAGLAAKMVWASLKGVSDSAAELTRRIGNWNYGEALFNSELASSVDFIKTAVDLADKTGLSVDGVFTRADIARAAEFKNLTGSTADQANNLLIRSRLVGQSTNQYRDSLTKGANEANALYNSVVNLREVQKGVLELSDATALSYGNNAESLGRAVTAAKLLGLNLSDMERISQSLINFESNISSEMQAQLLTGHQLNLAKAREYALWNNLEGVASEIERQGIVAADFTRMNVIQQENVARALGMSREELAKSLILRQLNNGASAEALANATHMTKEQIEAIGLTERWRIVLDKLKQSFITILEVVEPVVKYLAKAIATISNGLSYLTGWIGGGRTFQKETESGLLTVNKTATTTKASFGGIASALALVAFAAGPVSVVLKKLFSGIVGGAGASIRGIKGLVTSVIHPIDAFKRLKTAAQTAFGGSVKAKVSKNVADKVSTEAAANKGTGKNLGTLGKNLKSFYRSMQSITFKSIGTAIAVGAASLVAAPGIALLAAISNIPHGGLITLGKSLGSFFGALGKAAQNPYTWLGVGLFAVIGAALIPFTYALSLLAPLVESLGKALSTVLTTVFIGFSRTLKTVGQVLHDMSFADIGKLALLGLTLTTFSLTVLSSLPGLLMFGLLGLPVLFGVSSTIKKLADSSGGIRSLGLGITNLISPLRELGKVLKDLDEDKLESLSKLNINVTSINRKNGITEAESNAKVAANKSTRIKTVQENRSSTTTSTPALSKVETILLSIDKTLKTGKTVSIDYDRLSRGLQIYTV